MVDNGTLPLSKYSNYAGLRGSGRKSPEHSFCLSKILIHPVGFTLLSKLPAKQSRIPLKGQEGFLQFCSLWKVAQAPQLIHKLHETKGLLKTKSRLLAAQLFHVFTIKTQSQHYSRLAHIIPAWGVTVSTTVFLPISTFMFCINFWMYFSRQRF